MKRNTHMLAAFRGRCEVMRNTWVNRLAFAWWCRTFYGSEKECLEEAMNY